MRKRQQSANVLNWLYTLRFARTVEQNPAERTWRQEGNELTLVLAFFTQHTFFFLGCALALHAVDFAVSSMRPMASTILRSTFMALTTLSISCTEMPAIPLVRKTYVGDLHLVPF